jgi:hypothetical protein
MNIFVLDESPSVAAEYHMDVHVVKMILETAQMLSTAHRILDHIPDGETALYKKTHVNHPCAVWARENSENYLWAFTLYLSLCDEYTYRFGKIHKTDRQLTEILCELPKNIPRSTSKTKFALAMPEEFKYDDAIKSYRSYYQFKANTLSRVSWKKRKIPNFIQ